MSLYDELKLAENKSVSFPKLFDKITIEKNFLSVCSLELTPLCNFKCKFCYARLSPEELQHRKVKLFGFNEWKRYIDELADNNCLHLNLTGGECTLHPDFVRIYEHAYDRGFMITVFTNGSNITDEILESFTKRPPYRIYLTLYGATYETYERVTGDGKYCEIVKNNVKKIVDKGFDLILQATLSSENVDDGDAMFEFAHGLGCEFRLTSELNSYGNCTDDIIDELTADEKKANEISDNIWHKKRNISKDAPNGRVKRRIAPIPSDPDAVGIKCNAGRNACFINHNGIMSACNCFDAFTIDTKDKGVKECFDALTSWADTVPRIKECDGCIHAFHCITCIALHYNDTHKLGVPSPRICFKVREPEKAREEQEFFQKHGYLEI